MQAFDQILAKAEVWVSKAMHQLPYLESLALDMLDAAFAPRQILKQIAMIFALQITLILSNGVYANFQTVRNLVTSAGKKEKQLMELLARANSYTEWKHIAVLLDEARGLDKWRSEEECSLYDAQVCHSHTHTHTYTYTHTRTHTYTPGNPQAHREHGGHADEGGCL
ncbi:DUF3336 domain-containing protein [archaeon]|nr:MAG: DUF3336 domain-containing protein [archaeon]